MEYNGVLLAGEAKVESGVFGLATPSPGTQDSPVAIMRLEKEEKFGLDGHMCTLRFSPLVALVEEVT